MTRSWSIIELMRSRRCFSDAPWLTLPPSCAGPAPQSSPEPPGLWPAGCSVPAATRWLVGAYAPCSCGRNWRPAAKAAGGPALSPRCRGRNCKACAVGVPSARRGRVSEATAACVCFPQAPAAWHGACDAPNKWDLEAARGNATLAAPGLGEPSAQQKREKGSRAGCRPKLGEEKAVGRGRAAAGASRCCGTLRTRLGVALAAR